MIFFSHRSKKGGAGRVEDFAGEVLFPDYFKDDGGVPVRLTKETQMAWKTPKIVEVPVGMEINMYACAARK